MPVDIGSVEMHMGPTQVGAPDDLSSPLIAFIDGADEELLIAVQELESEPVARAITNAAARDVDVRVILERNYLGTANPPADPFGPGGQNDENRRLLSAVLRGGVQVTVDLNPETFHQKFIVRDPDRGSPHSAVLTGSTNFTPTGLTSNLNHIVIVNGKKVADVYRDEFEEMWSGTFGQLRERRDREPAEYTVSDIRVKVLFAPDHAPEMEIMKQMLKAQQRIDFAIFTFAQSSGIDDTMKVLDRSGIQVRGILDGLQGNQRWAATHALVGPQAPNSNIVLHLSQNVAPLNKLHHKLMTIDDRMTIAGSFNFTRPATRLNDENVVILGDLDEAAGSEADNKQRALALFARNEIDRMILAHGGAAL